MTLNGYLTIPGFEKLTPQHCFDMAARHIMKTRTKCTDGKGTCKYLGVGCAASVFLTQQGKEKGDSIDGATWDVLVAEGVVSQHNGRLIHELQAAHDGALDQAFMRTWMPKMEVVAHEFDLNTAELTR